MIYIYFTDLLFFIFRFPSFLVLGVGQVSSLKKFTADFCLSMSDNCEGNFSCEVQAMPKLRMHQFSQDRLINMFTCLAFQHNVRELFIFHIIILSFQMTCIVIILFLANLFQIVSLHKLDKSLPKKASGTVLLIRFFF